MERWIPAKGYEGRYEVSDLGRVRGIYMKKVLKPSAGSHGYPCVGIWNGSCQIGKPVHHMVFESFHGSRPCVGQFVIDHIDGDKRNNRLDNLQLITQRQNCIKGKNGLEKKTSKYRGVFWRKERSKWVACMRIKGEPRKYLGSFDSEEEAAKVYQDAVASYESTLL